MGYKRRLRLSVSDVPLLEALTLSPLERTIFMELVKLLGDSPLSTTEIERRFGGSTALNVLVKMREAGMIEKDGYRGKWRLSREFSRILREWAREWDKIVER